MGNLKLIIVLNYYTSKFYFIKPIFSYDTSMTVVIFLCKINMLVQKGVRFYFTNVDVI